MIEDLKCPKCGSEELSYRKIHKETPIGIRAASIIGALAFLGLGVGMLLNQDRLLRIVAVFFSFYILWMFLSGRMKHVQTSVMFRCNECNQAWDEETRGTAYTRNWREIPLSEWREVELGETVPRQEK
jgi:uncharacterized Zn finger protein